MYDRSVPLNRGRWEKSISAAAAERLRRELTELLQDEVEPAFAEQERLAAM